MAPGARRSVGLKRRLVLDMRVCSFPRRLAGWGGFVALGEYRWRRTTARLAWWQSEGRDVDWKDATVNEGSSPRAYALLKDSQEWGGNANASGNVDMGTAISKLHELLNRSIHLIAELEAEANRLG